jgi:inhibitor of cysteine peptidase
MVETREVTRIVERTVEVTRIVEKPVTVLMPMTAERPAATEKSVTTSPMIAGKARVESIEILILESFPVQVMVQARGNLPDGCTRIDRIEKDRDVEKRILWVEMTTARPRDALCTQALVPFQENISLDVLGLPAGTYTVDVNGVTGTFTLSVDNVPQKGDTG